ncbi:MULTISPECIES: acyl carrier protein [Eubacterium]|jgi:acyl carrier protein|uniref:Phosphopantetheine attachment site n=1 Tax=Eubacterium ruminantium TaxID=42322 RepID=A0A1T4QD63_9FIRM|nr:MULTISPECIES: acyl carrier protein [Eubacterium]MCR5367790.1 acyl carrier protein [Eubacterium sp.]SCW67054.1 Phosphopantetheine attachment site [Eubacterium ruminantium]SDN35941.1 Phosphopantetheine attachment site [Eubacterium ruminantium]SKA01178.1 Phosphopantetheine attachment site [Eubacterium ruminantium]
MSSSEERVYKIWCDVFKRNDIDIEDNFFEIGGNSLIGMKIITILNKELERIDVTDFFEYQTIKDIAAKIDRDYKWRKQP